MKPATASRLSYKLLLAIIPVVALAVGLVALLGYGAARREMLAAIDKEAGTLARRTASNIDELLEQRYRDLLTLSETPLIADYYRNVDFGLKDEARSYRRELARYFAGFAARSRACALIAYLDAAGREVARAGRGAAAPPDVLARIKALAPGRWESFPAREVAGLGPVVYFAKPVHDELGKLKGALVLAYDLAEIRSLLRAIVVGRGGRAYVVTEGGARLEGRLAPAGSPKMLRAESPVRRHPWTVRVEAPQDDFLGPLRSVRQAALWTCLAGLAGLSAVLLVLVRSITGPLAALAEAARRVGAGDLGTRVEARGGDEVGELASAFNLMTGRLEEDKRRNEELQAQLIQAEKLGAIGQLISAVAHELNNPLAAVAGYAQVARLEECPPRVREDLDRVQRNVMRCRKVVENLLFFARQSRGERRRVDLDAAADAALELLQYRLSKSEDVRVDRARSAEPPVTTGDFQQIVQVLVNLIGNACDAMEGFVRYPDPKRLTLRAGADEASRWIEVGDNGPGIPEAARGRIFQAFFTTKEPGRGTGLGLSICRQIAQEHGGTLAFETAEGRGTTFRLSLPAARAEDLDETGGEAEEPVYPAVPGRSVLVADDEAELAELIARLLREDGDEATAVHSGPEALRLVESRDFDLVVADMGMERVRGPDLYAALARRDPSRPPRVLFVTGDILNARVLEFFTRTKAEYALKPFDVDELRQTLRRLLAAPR